MKYSKEHDLKRVIHFLMAWHPRLGADALISKIISKDVAKLIAEQMFDVPRINFHIHDHYLCRDWEEEASNEGYPTGLSISELLTVSSKQGWLEGVRLTSDYSDCGLCGFHWTSHWEYETSILSRNLSEVKAQCCYGILCPKCVAIDDNKCVAHFMLIRHVIFTCDDEDRPG